MHPIKTTLLNLFCSLFSQTKSVATTLSLANECPIRQNVFFSVLIKNGNTYYASFWLNERPVCAVHFVVQAAGVAQVVSVTVPSPQGS